MSRCYFSFGIRRLRRRIFSACIKVGTAELLQNDYVYILYEYIYLCALDSEAETQYDLP